MAAPGSGVVDGAWTAPELKNWCLRCETPIESSPSKCENCHMAFYCCNTHLQLDFPRHVHECDPAAAPSVVATPENTQRVTRTRLAGEEFDESENKDLKNVARGVPVSWVESLICTIDDKQQARAARRWLVRAPSHALFDDVIGLVRVTDILSAYKVDKKGVDHRTCDLLNGGIAWSLRHKKTLTQKLVKIKNAHSVDFDTVEVLFKTVLFKRSKPETHPRTCRFGPQTFVACVVDNKSVEWYDASFSARDAPWYMWSPAPEQLPDRSCLVCGKEATNKCVRCKKARYCSRECQVVHWPKHKSTCKPEG